MQSTDSSLTPSFPLVNLNCVLRPNGQRKPRRSVTDAEIAALPPNSEYIVMACGALAIVDSDNFNELSKTSWSICLKKYAASRINYKLTYLHRLVAGAKDGEQVDHINGNTLDDRRCNLRVCTQSQNMCNKAKQSNNTSGHVGVAWFKQTQKWRVQVKLNGKTHSGGYYASIEDAVKARTALASKLHGEYVRIL